MFTQCSDDDDVNGNSSWKESDFYGYWYIDTVTYQGNTVEVPANFANCDPDYLTLSPDQSIKL